jgi:hypothetical protein
MRTLGSGTFDVRYDPDRGAKTSWEVRFVPIAETSVKRSSVGKFASFRKPGFTQGLYPPGEIFRKPDGEQSL